MGIEDIRARLAQDPKLYTAADLKPDTDGGRFGHIEGTKVGQIWPSRRALSEAGVHAPLYAGIAVARDGAGSPSVILSGGYRDDIDLGDTVLYTGAGGRAKGESFGGSAVQTEDQSFEHVHNRALQISCERGRPVRLIRGIPDVDGQKAYRYDGLYNATSAILVKGSGGYAICQFKLIRQEGQPS